MDYRKHIEDLAAKMDARVEYVTDNSFNARAFTDADDLHIELPHWSTNSNIAMSQFWAAMHELGHIYYRHQGQSELDMLFGILNPQVPGQEAQAWEWGIHNAGIPLNAHGRAMIAASIASYVHDGQGFTTVERDLVPLVAEVIKMAGEKPNWKLLSSMFENDPEDRRQMKAEEAAWSGIFKHYVKR